MIIDESENDSKNFEMFKKINEILTREFPKGVYERGICHRIWMRKKWLLKELYNFEWKSPAELNPGIIFD